MIQFLLAYNEQNQGHTKFSLHALQNSLIREGHLNPVHPKTNKQVPMIYQVVNDTPSRLSNVVKLDYNMSVQQNYQRMENKKWFYMSVFELLAKREEAVNANLLSTAIQRKLLQINLFRQQDEAEVMVMQRSKEILELGRSDLLQNDGTA